MVEKKELKAISYGTVIVGCFLIIIPLYLTIITTFKTPQETTAGNFFALPQSLYFGNYKEILANPSYFSSLLNTLFISLFTVVGGAIVMPMMSYAIARSMSTSKVYRLVYFYMLLGIFIPFQVKMMPLVKLMSTFGLLNPIGLVILCISSTACESVFLYTGYMNSLSTDMEEAAIVDGATTFQTYTKIIFPLLRPMMATIFIKDALWMWNDFLLPLLILNRSPKNWTLTLFQNSFRTEYTTNYGLVFTTFVLSMLPILLVYIFAQKHIISGLTSGSVKG